MVFRRVRQAWARQLVRQLGLAGENDLHQLRFGRLEIGKHAHRFKHGIVEILCFVHDQNKTFPREHGVKQNLVQLIVHRDKTHSLGIDV